MARISNLKGVFVASADSNDPSLPSLQKFAHPLGESPSRYDPLIEMIGDSRYVLLGEATHGTHEFYQARAEITRRLIIEKGFTVVAWEADWPDTLRVNRYVQGADSDCNAVQSLTGFQRFPTWMWRNEEVVEFVEWLKQHNQKLPATSSRAGVYGLDLYSLHASMNEVIRYLDKTDPEAARTARARYSCFEHFGDDPQAYGMTANQHRSLSCEDEVVKQLADLQAHAADFLRHDGRLAADELFYAEQNARVAKNAEHYYRAMYHGRPNTWNLRDKHMTDALNNLLAHLEKQHARPKAVIWAHNSHLGDARATQMKERGELNVGQLIREQHEGDCVLVGFSTYTGTVTAASEWGEVAERKQVRPGMKNSYENLFHQVGIPQFLLTIRDNPELFDHLKKPRAERAIGVIYKPETELWSHYFQASLSGQFDAILHFDESRAVRPLETSSTWEAGEFPETFPSGF
ncbi:MAG: erythromycin esterase-like enzyme [Verrucomicrobiales bacterium]|nr:erythromycin esterase-like enzyme [Verrucomicrobiales bacterium]